MNPDRDENPKSEQEQRLKRMYGTLPTKSHLLHHQLGGRTYFDSGDFALSKARKSSDIGQVETGKEHPVREHISQPASAAPGSSNVTHEETPQRHDTGSPTDVKPSSHLHDDSGSQEGTQLRMENKT